MPIDDRALEVLLDPDVRAAFGVRRYPSVAPGRMPPGTP